MKEYPGVNLKLHTFLTSAFWKKFCTCRIGELVGPQSVLTPIRTENSPYSTANEKNESLMFQHVA
jgi:hypothetical protein